MRQLKRGLVWVSGLLIGVWVLAQCRQVVHWLWLLGYSALPSNVLWTNIKELFWPVASAIAVATFMSTRRIRRRDMQLRQIDTTLGMIKRYNSEIRAIVVDFQTRFDETISDHDVHDTGSAYFVDKNLISYESDVARTCGAAKMLHLLDELSFVLKQEQYVDRDEVLAAIDSEVRPFCSIRNTCQP